jgi:hypothetical protein
LIKTWQPWEQSTGAKTEQGKAIVSRNAYRGGSWRLIRLMRWVQRGLRRPEILTEENVNEASQLAVTLTENHFQWCRDMAIKYNLELYEDDGNLKPFDSDRS